jgi:hypothetical protein
MVLDSMEENQGEEKLKRENKKLILDLAAT